MTYRNHCNSLNSHNYTGGKNNLIADLIAAGSHRVETWGNSREGFTVYLTDAPGFHIGCALSSGPYTLRRDAVAACKRVYGARTQVFRGRNFP